MEGGMSNTPINYSSAHPPSRHTRRRMAGCCSCYSPKSVGNELQIINQMVEVVGVLPLPPPPLLLSRLMDNCVK